MAKECPGWVSDKESFGPVGTSGEVGEVFGRSLVLKEELQLVIGGREDSFQVEGAPSTEVHRICYSGAQTLSWGLERERGGRSAEQGSTPCRHGRL